MARNGKRRPGRPRLELALDGIGAHPAEPGASGAAASPEEAAAIAAAIEQFLRDTAPTPEAPGPSLSPWARAALIEATGRRRVESAADVRFGN